MTTPLPLLPVTPNAGVAASAPAAALSGTAGASNASDVGAFATLIAQQLAGGDTNVPPALAEALALPLERAASLIPPGLDQEQIPLISALSNGPQITDEKQKNSEIIKLADATAATLSATGEPAPAIVIAEASSATDASVIVLNAPPAPAPDEAALTDAAGGEDTSAESIDAALAAALDVGIVPVEGERMVQSAVLPTAVRSAASVQVLDQLLGRLLASTSTDKPGQASPAAPELNALGRVIPSGSVASPAPAIEVAASKPHLDRAAPLASGKMGEADATALQGAANVTHDDAVSIAPAAPFVAATQRLQGTPQERAAPTLFAPSTEASIDSDGIVLPLPTTPKESGIQNTPADSPQSRTVLHQGIDATKMQGDLAGLLRDRFGLEVSPQVSLTTGPERAPDLAAAPRLPGVPAPALASLAAAQMFAGMQGAGDGPLANASSQNGIAIAGTGVMVANGDGPTNDGGASDFLMSGQGFGNTELLSPTDAGADSLDGPGSFGTLVTVTSGQAAPTKTASAALPTHATPPMVPPDQVAVHIAAAARDGARNLSIQLRPAALGRIEVELSVSREGTVKARVQAERSETLELLQRDARGLERALEAAGLKAETGGLSFSLKDGGRQDRQPLPSHAPAGLVTADLAVEPVIANHHVYRGQAGHGRALDIEV